MPEGQGSSSSDEGSEFQQQLLQESEMTSETEEQWEPASLEEKQ